MFKNLNENMSHVIADASQIELTPASIYAKLLEQSNPVSSYFSGKSDIEAIKVDLYKEHQKQKDNPKYKKAVKKFVRETGKTRDRYLDELRFFHLSLGSTGFSNTATDVFGKYINLDYINEDIGSMIDPKPLQSWEADHDTILDAFGRNLTQLAEDHELHKIVDRDEEIMRVIQILTRQTKSNPVLVGEAGVGKTAVVEKLAFLLNDKVGIPSALHGWKLYEINMHSVIATDKIEEVIEAIIEAAIQEKAILFIDEVHVIQTYQNGKIANILKPAMARGDIKLIGATTEDEYKSFEKDKAMTRRWQPVKIQAPDKMSVYRILKTKADETEEYHHVIIPEETILKAIQLSERFMQHRQQPDKSIDLIEEAAAKLRMSLESKPDVLLETERNLSDAEIEKEMLEVRAKNPSKREQDKIKALEKKIQEYKEEYERLTLLYSDQKVLFTNMVHTKELLKIKKEEREKMLQLGDFNKAVELETKDIPELHEKYKEIEKQIIDFAQSSDEALVQNVVMPDMIARIIEDQTGIPAKAQDQDDLDKYRDIEVTLKGEIHGQDKPIDTITAAIKRSKAGLADPNKPLGSFLCLGPTGVGKTYLAQKLSEFMFDTDKVMHRFDMSEFMEGHSVARLFGSPPGYVGHDEGGQLTELVKRNPYSIVLFDEIEKAHPRVFDALLQIMDSGRMTDGKGTVVDFKNTIILMTSNHGSDIIREGLLKGYDIDVIEEALLQEVQKHFRPEFLNRFDAKVMFNSLKPEAVVKIAESELSKLAERLLTDNGFDMYWHPNVPVFITNQAYSLTDGARPIKRYINDIIVNLLTEKILAGEITKDDVFYVAAEEELTVFSTNPEELKSLREAEGETTMELKAVMKDKVNPYKVSSSDIVDADIGGKKGKKKKKKKWDKSFKLDTEAGD